MTKEQIMKKVEKDVRQAVDTVPGVERDVLHKVIDMRVESEGEEVDTELTEKLMDEKDAVESDFRDWTDSNV